MTDLDLHGRLSRLEAVMTHIAKVVDEDRGERNKVLQQYLQLAVEVARLKERTDVITDDSTKVHTSIEANSAQSIRTRALEEERERSADNRWGRIAVIISALTFSILLGFEVIPAMFGP